MSAWRALAVAVSIGLSWLPGATAHAADGAKVFADTCQACHQPGGVGAPGLAPPLVSLVIKNAAARQKDYPAKVVIKGLSGPIALTDGSTLTGAMPPQQALSDGDVAAVVNYVFHLNHAPAAVKAADVAAARAQPATNEDLKRLRMDLAK
ncbi:MAG: c-type cytochrome [Xanthobacteraceae bacterium]